MPIYPASMFQKEEWKGEANAKDGTSGEGIASHCRRAAKSNAGGSPFLGPHSWPKHNPLRSKDGLPPGVYDFPARGGLSLYFAIGFLV